MPIDEQLREDAWEEIGRSIEHDVQAWQDALYKQLKDVPYPIAKQADLDAYVDWLQNEDEWYPATADQVIALADQFGLATNWLPDDIAKFNDCHDENGQFCSVGGEGGSSSGSGKPEVSQDKFKQSISTGKTGFLGKHGFETVKWPSVMGYKSTHPTLGTLYFSKTGKWQLYDKSGNQIQNGPGLVALKEYAKQGWKGALSSFTPPTVPGEGKPTNPAPEESKTTFAMGSKTFYKPEKGETYDYKDMHITPTEYNAIKSYTGVSHVSVNSYLHEGKLMHGLSQSAIQEKVKALDSAIERHEIRTETTMWHGTKYSTDSTHPLFIDKVAGKVINTGAFRSMSRSFLTSSTFTSGPSLDNPHGVVFLMHLPVGTKALNVEKVSSHTEQESMLGRHCKLQVSSTYKLDASGNKRVYDVHVIPMTKG